MKKYKILLLVFGLLLAGCGNPWRLELGENAPPTELCNLSPKGYIYDQQFSGLGPDEVQATDCYFLIPDRGLALEVVVKPSEQLRVLNVRLCCIGNNMDTKEPVLSHVINIDPGEERQSVTFEGLDPNQFYFLRLKGNLDSTETFPFSLKVWAVESDSQIIIRPTAKQDWFQLGQIDGTLLQFLQVLPFAMLIGLFFALGRFRELREGSLLWTDFLLQSAFVC